MQHQLTQMASNRSFRTHDQSWTNGQGGVGDYVEPSVEDIWSTLLTDWLDPRDESSWAVPVIQLPASIVRGCIELPDWLVMKWCRVRSHYRELNVPQHVRSGVSELEMLFQLLSFFFFFFFWYFDLFTRCDFFTLRKDMFKIMAQSFSLKQYPL